ncbi:MAG: tRNA 2-selenouridine(34) synthase MnmH, partial [Chitinophagales bacterium]|nr:tRNA 2-selenouridine(34) synthase MnmH [Chitinophagales bacterium]
RNMLQTSSQEQFENKLMHQLRKMDLSKKIWIEDESVVIGNIGIPRFFWYQMQAAKVINLEIDLETRVAFLLETYGILDKDFLISATEHIRKRLGPLQTKNAIAAIQENRMEDFIRTVLVYYDKGYLRCIQKRNPETVFTLTLNYSDTKTVAEKIIEFSKDMN